MAMDKDQLRSLIKRTLKYLDPEIPYSEHAVELLMLTAAQESHLGTYLKQIKGPALGIFQMEPNTEEDIFDNYLNYKVDLEDKVIDTISNVTFWDEGLTDLEHNLLYAICMARVHYKRVPEALPTDLEGYARYWKKYWNTHLGKGTEEEAVKNYKRFAL